MTHLTLGSSTSSSDQVSRPRPLVACVTPTPQVEQGLLSPTPLVRTPLADITSHGQQGSVTTPRVPLAELDSSQLSQRLFHSPAPSLPLSHSAQPSPSSSMCRTSPSHLLLTQVPQSAANQSGVQHKPGVSQHRERRHQLNTERQLVELRQQVEQLGTMMGECLFPVEFYFNIACFPISLSRRRCGPHVRVGAEA